MTTRPIAGATLTRWSISAKTGGPGAETVRALAAQSLAFALLAIQQVALVPLYIHCWGIAVYGDWLVIFFAANLLRISDFGLVFSLGNTLRLAKARNDLAEYERTIRQGQLIYAFHFVTVTVLVGIAASYMNVKSALSVEKLNITEFRVCIISLGIGTLLSLWRDFLFLIYPAHNELDRGVTLFNLQLLVRLAVVSSALITGCGPVGVSIGWALVDVLAGLGIVFVDLRRRYPWGPLWPDLQQASECSRYLKALKSYTPSYVADQLLLNAPVLILGAVSLPQHDIVVFNIARTYSNIARQFLTQYSRTFGLQVSQTIISDMSIAAKQYINGVRLLAVVSGCLVGTLIAAAPLVYKHWMGDSSLFDMNLVWWMVLGFCLIGPAQVPLSLFRHVPAQLTAAAALSLQAASSLLFGALLAWSAGALGLAIVLVLAEVIFIAGPTGYQASKMLNLAYARYAINGFGVSVAVSAIVGGVVHLAILPLLVKVVE